MRDWVHVALPARISFGPGRIAHLPAELDLLGVRAPLLVVARPDGELWAAARAALGGRAHLPWREVVPHVPTRLAEAATAAAGGADGVVTVGGGSTTGLGKAVARRLGLPLLAVPTTYAGSEMTDIWGETEDARKTTGRDPRALPRTVVYDVALTVGLPPGLTASSGLNALAHCAEATYAPGASPVHTRTAVAAVTSLVEGLPAVLADPADLDARAAVLLGACLSGSVLAGAGVSVHHHVCHVLGGLYDLPHAELHAVVLAHALDEVQRAAPGSLDELAPALRTSGPEVPRAVRELTRTLGLPQDLATLGMGEDRIEAAVGPVVEATRADPTPLGPTAARRLLRRAVTGDPSA